MSVMGFGPWMTDLSPLDQGAGWLGIFDNITNVILMPIVAILTCVFIGYVIKVTVITDEVKAEGNTFRSEKAFVLMIKYICPVFLVVMLVYGLLQMVGVLPPF